MADRATERRACPFCGAEPDPNAFLSCGDECRAAGEHTQKPGCFYVGVPLEPCCPSAPYRVGLVMMREALKHPDEQLSARRYRNGDTAVRFTPGDAYMEVCLEPESFALLTDEERTRIERLLPGGTDG